MTGKYRILQVIPVLFVLFLMTGCLSEADRHYRAAINLHNDGYVEAAITEYSETIKIEPDYVAAYVNRGMAYEELGQYQNALQDYDKAVSLDPDNDYAYFYRGFLYGNGGEYEKAIADFDEAIRLNPDEADVYFYRGAAYMDIEQYQNALIDFTEVISIDSDYEYAYFYRGTIRVIQNIPDMAITDFSEVIRLNPENNDAYVNRALVYTQLENDEAAEKDVERAVELGYSRAEIEKQISQIKNASVTFSWNTPVGEVVIENQSRQKLTVYYQHRQFAELEPGDQESELILVKDLPSVIAAQNSAGELVFLQYFETGDYEVIAEGVFEAVIPAEISDSGISHLQVKVNNPTNYDLELHSSNGIFATIGPRENKYFTVPVACVLQRIYVYDSGGQEIDIVNCELHSIDMIGREEIVVDISVPAKTITYHNKTDRRLSIMVAEQNVGEIGPGETTEIDIPWITTFSGVIVLFVDADDPDYYIQHTYNTWSSDISDDSQPWFQYADNNGIVVIQPPE